MVRTGALILIMLLGCLCIGGLVTNGAAAHATTTPAGKATFPCAPGVSPDAVDIWKSNDLGNHGTRFRPFQRLVQNRGAVQQLFRATCHLQPVRGKGYHCPADFAVAYHLNFERRGKSVLRVVADAGGCTFLYDSPRLFSGRAYWIWYGPPISPQPAWMPVARRWGQSLAQALNVSVSTLRATAGH